MAPNNPIDLTENVLNKELPNKPAKETALQKELVMMVTADVPDPKDTKRSL